VSGADTADVVISADRPDGEELLDLYTSVAWDAYTRDPETLTAAIDGSSYVVTARLDGVLLGLARVISDSASICYLQDVLVRPTARRQGIGRRLVLAALQPYIGVRQKVLLTDDDPGQRAFYESLGYAEVRDVGRTSLRAFVRFDPFDPFEQHPCAPVAPSGGENPFGAAARGPARLCRSCPGIPSSLCHET